MNHSTLPLCFTLLTMLLGLGAALHADDVPSTAATPTEVPFAKQQFDPPVGLVRLAKEHDIWLDLKRKRVVIDGVVTLREGQLEMFACPRQTKEHESVVAVNCKARDVHAGLLAAGGKVGGPAKFDPEYTPATGSIIDIDVLWQDEDGTKHHARAQEWVRNVRTGKAMTYDWVFAGSGVWVDPDNGERFYHVDAGDFICVSNFPSATLDLPVESSQANSSLLFESFTENIPPKGTPVRLVLTPRPAKPADTKPADTKPADAKPEDAKPTDAKGAAKTPDDANDTKPKGARPSTDEPAAPADQ